MDQATRSLRGSPEAHRATSSPPQVDPGRGQSGSLSDGSSTPLSRDSPKKAEMQVMSLDFLRRPSMYDKVESPSAASVEGASLGLGPVKYMWGEGSKNLSQGASHTASVPVTKSAVGLPVTQPQQSLQPDAQDSVPRISAAAPRSLQIPALKLDQAPMSTRESPPPAVPPPTPTAGHPTPLSQAIHQAPTAKECTIETSAEPPHLHQAPRDPMAQPKLGGPGGKPAVVPVVVPLPTKWRNTQIKSILFGTIGHSPQYGEVEILEDAVVIVSKTGKVLLVATQDMEHEREILAWGQRFGAGSCTPVVQSDADRASGAGHMDVIRLARGQVLVPGFIDTHIHAPQYSYTGTATDKPLMEWLNHYTFPAERRLADERIAARVYASLVERTLRGGTTTALYFATIHVPASKILADIALHKGQRAYIGKVCMDRYSPPDYSETTAESLAGTEAFIHYVRSLRTELVQPVITPRFIPTCTPELLQGLGQLARKYDCHVQSHISESHDEMQFVAQLHPGEGSDADIFDRHGLLTNKCVMAHGVHLNRDDAELLRARGTAVAHCPLSNFFFGDGVLATAKLVAMGNKVGLGTDVAGGYCPCMLSSIRNAVLADRSVRQGGRVSIDCLSSSQRTGADRAAACAAAAATYKKQLEDMPEKMDWRHALYLATMGGAQALGIEKEVGTIEVGKSFDALLLDVAGGGIDLFETDGSRSILEKILNLGTEHNVSKVWVCGRSVHHKPVYRGPQVRTRPSTHPSLPQPQTTLSPKMQPQAGMSPKMLGTPQDFSRPKPTPPNDLIQRALPASPKLHDQKHHVIPPTSSPNSPSPPPTLGLPVSHSPGPGTHVPPTSPRLGGLGTNVSFLGRQTSPSGPFSPFSPNSLGRTSTSSMLGGLGADARPPSPHREAGMPVPPPPLSGNASAPSSPLGQGQQNSDAPAPLYSTGSTGGRASGSRASSRAGEASPRSQLASPRSPPEPHFTPPAGVYDAHEEVSDEQELSDVSYDEDLYEQHLYEHSFSDTEQDVGAC